MRRTQSAGEMRHGRRPKYAEIADRLADAITSGAYADGDRLPSVRETMSADGVSQATAIRVMLELEGRGLALSRPRSGFFARRPSRGSSPLDGARGLPGIPAATDTSPCPYSVDVLGLATGMFDAFRTPGLTALGAAELDRTLLPTAEISAAGQRAIRRVGAHALATPGPFGVMALRQAIARLLPRRGISASADDVVVTAGETDAMALALRAVTRPGGTVAVESPTYYGILQEAELAGLAVVEVSTHPTTGIDVDDLIRIADAMQIDAVILNPTFENPFGCCMEPYALRAVAEAMASRRIPIIEDDVYSELSFRPSPPRALASFDPSGNTIYCASFSKVISPGLRVGWCLPGRFKEAIFELQRRRAATVSSYAQHVLAEYLSGRRFNRHVVALRGVFAKQKPAFRKMVQDAFPPGTSVTDPQGGFLYWIEVPAPFDAMGFYRSALDAGISIAPGPVFSASGRFDRSFRISLGRKLTPEVQRAISRLGQLAHRAQATDRRIGDDA